MSNELYCIDNKKWHDYIFNRILYLVIYQNCDGYHNENIAADNLELKFHMFSTLSSIVIDNKSCDLECIKFN